jgi:hypothetical protein
MKVTNSNARLIVLAVVAAGAHVSAEVRLLPGDNEVPDTPENRKALEDAKLDGVEWPAAEQTAETNSDAGNTGAGGSTAQTGAQAPAPSPAPSPAPAAAGAPAAPAAPAAGAPAAGWVAPNGKK